ncbi:MAG: DMT family transporter [Desulfobacteraceae bacterium]|nr:MAG: DMT family transporter [Desulfobacteraceae bacterium]
MNWSAHKKGICLIHLATLLFGFSGLFGKFLSCSSLVIVFGRTVFAALTLFLAIRFFTDQEGAVKTGRHLGWYALQGLLLAVHWCAFFYSIQISSVAIGLITFSTFPLFVTFMEPAFFKEPLTLFNVGCAVAVFIGICLVVPDLDLSNQFTRGAFWGIFSGFTFALLAMVNRKNVKTLHPIRVSLFQNLFAALFLLFPLLITSPAPPGIRDIGLLVILGVIFTALAHTLFISSLSIISAQTASVIIGLEPVYGIFLALFLLSEVPDLKTIVGGIIIIITTMAAGWQSSRSAQP